MAKRLNTSDVLQLLEDNDFGLFEEDNSDFEGEGIESHLPRADPELSHVEYSEVMEEDEELMDFEDIVFDDSSSSSDESVTQPLGKYYCSKRYKKISVSISAVFGSTQSHSSPTSHRAQISSSSDEVSSDDSELEFTRSNDDDDSSQVEDQQEQGGGVRGRGCMQPR